MMNRRARIKGIANIPVRRKTEAVSNDNNIKVEQVVSPEKQEIEHKSEIFKFVVNNQENSVINNVDINKTELLSENHKPEIILSSNKLENNHECQDITSADVNNTVSEPDNVKSDVNIKTETNNISTNPIVSRRWIPKPKPIVKNPSLLRRPKPVLLKEKTETCINQNIENEKPNLSSEEIKSPPLNQISVLPIQEKPSPQHESILRSPTRNDSIVKSSIETDKLITSPLSPSKILNRSRIRPNLIRRNSVQGSASESEDDGRRSRIRNDSVCSTTSYTEIIVKENNIISKDKLISIKVHKLFRRSEQSRKVAEARREFYQKFGTTLPDKKRLTMMDLIYYNPVTNPMPPRKPQNTSTDEIILVDSDKPEEVENVDDPEQIEDDTPPVPQVKVGPDGEIILDEQSLVIEQTGTKKGREQIANSQIVNVDDLDRAYGIYKRPKRAKDWTAIETLRFYRSLNTVGTDFSLMVSLFPGRTRRELKMKFKKEEKINRQLIDKALTNPVDFDLSDLEKQLVEEEEIIKKMEEEEKRKKAKPRKQRQKYKQSVLALQMEEENDDPQEKIPRKLRPKRIKKMGNAPYSALNLTGLTTSESESENELPSKMRKTEKGKFPVKRIPRKRNSCKQNITDDLNLLVKDENTPKNENLIYIEERNNNEMDEKMHETDDKTKENCVESIKCDDSSEKCESIEKMHETNEYETNDNNCETNDNKCETNDNYDETNDGSDETNDDYEENSLVTINNAADENNENSPENDQNSVVPNILPNNLSTVEPGSIMILTSIGPDGQQIYKMFMVTAGQSKVPIDLSDDVVQSLTSSLGSAQAVTLDLPVIDSDQVILS